MIDLDSKTTALVLIDLQNGIIGMPLAPRAGAEVLETSKALAARFREAGAPVVLVHVGWAADYSDAPSVNVDQPLPRPPGGLPPAFSDLAPGLAQPTDIVVLKRHWGAFHGTALDLLLRRRGVKTIVLGGIATNFGVDTTAREAWQHGYDVVVAEDAVTGTKAELHRMAFDHVLPRVARIGWSKDVRLQTA